MPRSITFSQPNDTCLFTPLQIQPVTVFRFGMSTWARWLSEHIASFPSLVRDHGFGAVVIGAHITWLTPCGFFDCDGLRVTGDVVVVNRGKLFREHYRVTAVGGRLDGQDVVDGIGIVRPLFVGNDAGMGAMPIPVPPQLLQRLQPDEIDDAAKAPRPIGDVLARVDGETPLGEGTVHTFCSRAFSEVADQWSFVEVPAFASHGREALVLASGSKVPELRRGLREPMRDIVVEYRKPAFAFDELDVRTRAFVLDRDLVFVHAIHVTSDADPRALIVERF